MHLWKMNRLVLSSGIAALVVALGVGGVVAAGRLSQSTTSKASSQRAAAHHPATQVNASGAREFGLSGVSESALHLAGISLSAPLGRAEATISSIEAQAVATNAIGAGSRVISGPVLLVMSNPRMPAFNVARLCWVMEVAPAHPILPRAPGQVAPLGSEYLSFVDATTGEWLYGAAGAQLP